MPTNSTPPTSPRTSDRAHEAYEGRLTGGQLMLIYTNDFNAEQRRRATQVMQRNLKQSTDWIVLAQTANTLARWAKTDEDLKRWLIPHLQELESDPRRAVAGKATKMLALLEAKQ